MQATGAEVLRRLGRPPMKLPTPAEESLIDELIMKVASPRTKELLQDYAEQYQVQGRRPLLKLPTPTEESPIDELVMKVASPRTKDLLQDYAEQYQVH
jgi:hypothetical protein